QELQTISGWPTIPQIFVKGELIGGADITQELAETGELTRILEAKLGAEYRDAAEEHVVEVVSGSRALCQPSDSRSRRTRLRRPAFPRAPRCSARRASGGGTEPIRARARRSACGARRASRRGGGGRCDARATR